MLFLSYMVVMPPLCVRADLLDLFVCAWVEGMEGLCETWAECTIRTREDFSTHPGRGDGDVAGGVLRKKETQPQGRGVNRRMMMIAEARRWMDQSIDRSIDKTPAHPQTCKSTSKDRSPPWWLEPMKVALYSPASATSTV